MKSVFISVNLKKSTDIDWVAPLNRYLLSIYGTNTEYIDDLNSFNKLRQDVKGCNVDEFGKDLYYKYYGQLELLDLRIPFNNVKMNFTWYDSFQTATSNSQHSLAFEKASILFNLGSLLSNLAKANYDEENYKESIKYYQYSAGIFKFLGENFLHAPSNDLNQATVKFLNKLMLAQAQELFVLKLLNEGSEKYSLISKLCTSCATYYSGSVEALKVDDEDKVPAKIDVFWTNLCDYKAGYYKSLADYYHGLYLEGVNKIGEAIAYHNLSITVLADLPKSFLGTDFGKFQENIKIQQAVVTEKVAILEKDNDFIYHDSIPQSSNLAEIKPMDSVKATPLNEQNFSDLIGKDFFEKIVPMNIHELNSLYSEEQAKLLRTQMENIEVSNEELSSVLEFLKLPRALINIKETINSKPTEKVNSIDPKILQIATDIQMNSSENTRNKSKIGELNREIFSILNSCDSTIKQNPNPSSLASLKDELAKAKVSLIDATEADKKLAGLVNDAYLLEMLSKGPNSFEFSSYFGDSSPSSSNEVSLLDMEDSSKDVSKINSQIRYIEDQLLALNNLKKDKALLVTNLKKDIHDDDISQILILNSKKVSKEQIEETIFKQELLKFKPYEDQVSQLVDKQTNLINELKSHWAELLQNDGVLKAQSKSSQQSNAITEKSITVANFYKNWKTYSDGLAKGLSFYNQLLSYVKSLEANITSSSRSSSVSSFNNDLPSQFGSMNISQSQPPSIPSRPRQLSNSYAPQQQQQPPPPPPQQRQPSFNQYTQPQYNPTAQYTGSHKPSYNSQPSYNAPPPVPPQQQSFSAPQSYNAPQQPKNPPSGLSSLSMNQYQQPNQPKPTQSGFPQQYQPTQQYQPQDRNPGLIYNQPSAYDPNLYNSFGSQQPASQSIPPTQPQYSYPYDPNNSTR